MPVVKTTPAAAQALKSELARSGQNGPVRVEIRSTGCCDASLGLSIGEAKDDDLHCADAGVAFLISRDTHDVVGDITIDYSDEPYRRGFVITSSKPLGEWSGFGVCTPNW